MSPVPSGFRCLWRSRQFPLPLLVLMKWEQLGLQFLSPNQPFSFNCPELMKRATWAGPL